MTTSFDKLVAQPVLETALRLTDRIGARFPERGLHSVARELAALTAEVAATARRQRRRLRLVRDISRVLVTAIVTLAAVALAFAAHAAFTDRPDGLDWVPLVESTVNDAVFVAIAVAVLYSAPERLQRSSVLELLHRLRSLAHIIDMHQLTKDPERLRGSFHRTEASPVMDLSPDELEYYLEYCSELLSLVGKTAALCAEESRDSVVLDTVSTIETLTVGMSRKIWQKIFVLNAERDRN
ncbi:hypothetical protein L1785_01260 [Antribacter sp. KLBMP9083]|uniref:Uncharacterized protein n=1 Tax=Antribacter soli TaxID=2910976 RepID=A0AA41QA05_9MICO|nr:hypothetical protein [Antribacter soli]MCF4119605.1 hypothetical protein [Antribacter soli]